VADFNGDDKPDLAVADYDYETQTIALRLGNGDGSFQPLRTFAVPELAQSLAAADLNGDQTPDLVSNGAVLIGDGTGGFLPANRFPLGAPPYLVRVGDLNADAKPDVVLASAGSNNVSVLLNRGDGNLTPPRYYQTGNHPAEVAIVDLDGDNKTDLLVSNSHDDHLSLLYGKGDGYFSGLPAYPAIPDLNFVGAVDSVAADFSGDGIADLLVANHNQQAALLLGLGQGRFDSPALLPWPIDGVKVVSGDWNGDGKRDAAFLNSGSFPNLIISLGTGNGSFGNSETIALPEPNYFADEFLSLTSAQLNNDIYPDLIATNPAHNSLSLLLGNGAGGFTLQPALAVGVVPVAVASADFNGDGKQDLAIANQGDNESAPNGSLQLALGNGDGSFQAAQIVRAEVIARSLAAADFNQDGELDLAAIIGSSSQNDIEFFAGQGNGDFAVPRAMDLNLGGLAGLQAADADRDGKPDLGFRVSSSSRAAGLRGNGDGSFKLSGFISLGSHGDAKLAQLNEDTKPDLIVPTGIGFIAACLSQDCPLTAPNEVSGTGHLDPFLCRQASPAKAARGAGPYPKFSPVDALPVADALGVAEVEQARKMHLRKPAHLCNPVAIGPNDTETASHPAHLTGYLNRPTKTKPAQSKFQPQTVAVSNQLSRLSLTLFAPTNLLAPAAKAAGDGGATALSDTSLTHFQCYKAKIAKAKSGQAALPKFTPTELLLKDDQAGPLRFKLAPPSKVCAPAALDDSTASAFGKTELLTCYPVRLAKTIPAQTKPNSQIASVNDRFGAQVLVNKTAKELCLPSRLQ